MSIVKLDTSSTYLDTSNANIAPCAELDLPPSGCVAPVSALYVVEKELFINAAPRAKARPCTNLMRRSRAATLLELAAALNIVQSVGECQMQL